MASSARNPRAGLIEATHDPLTASPQMKRTESQHVSVQRLVVLHSDPFHSRIPLDQVSQDIEGLRILLDKGAWKSVVPLAQTCMAQARLPHQKMRFRLCMITALMKLGNYEQASGEFKDIGVFDEARYLCESFPENYPGKTGSLIPFHMRLLYAELLSHMGKDPHLDALFALLEYYKRHKNGTLTELDGRRLPLINQTSHCPPVFLEAYSEDQLSKALGEDTNWEIMINRIKFTIASRLLTQSNFTQSLQIISEVLTNHPEDPRLLAVVSRLYLQMGNIGQARKMYNKLESLITPDSDKSLTNLLLLHRAYIDLADDDLAHAIQNFDAILQAEPTHLESIANRALCLLHDKRLDEAIQGLEAFLFSYPEQIQETIVFNLCTLYDLAFTDNTDKKEKLLLQYHVYLSDNFDLSVFKLPA